MESRVVLIRCRNALVAKIDTAMEDTLDQLFYLRDVAGVMPPNPEFRFSSSSAPSISILMIQHIMHWLVVRVFATSILGSIETVPDADVADNFSSDDEVQDVNVGLGLFTMIQILTIFGDLQPLMYGVFALMAEPESSFRQNRDHLRELSDRLLHCPATIQRLHELEGPCLFRQITQLLYSPNDQHVLCSLNIWYCLLTNRTLRTIFSRQNPDAPSTPPSASSPSSPSTSSSFSASAPFIPDRYAPLIDELINGILYVFSRPYFTRLVSLQCAVDVLDAIVNVVDSPSDPSSAFAHRRNDIEAALQHACGLLVQIVMQSSEGSAGDLRLYDCERFMIDSLSLPKIRAKPTSMAHKSALMLPVGVIVTRDAASLPFSIPRSVTQLMQHSIHAYVILLHARNRITDSKINIQDLVDQSMFNGPTASPILAKRREGEVFELRNQEHISCHLIMFTGTNGRRSSRAPGVELYSRFLVIHDSLWVLAMPYAQKNDVGRAEIILSLPMLSVWCESDIGDARMLHFRISSFEPPPPQLGVHSTIITSTLVPSPVNVGPLDRELVTKEDIYQFQLSFMFDDTARCLKVKRHVDRCRHQMQSTVLQQLRALLKLSQTPA
jgi:hypothetical protein